MSERLVETMRCPNCGKLCRIGSCWHSSTIKTGWGSSTLYGVCQECAERHDSMTTESKGDAHD